MLSNMEEIHPAFVRCMSEVPRLHALTVSAGIAADAASWLVWLLSKIVLLLLLLPLARLVSLCRE